MEQGLPFDRNDLDKINTNLLVSLISQQQALFEILFDHLGLKKEDVENRAKVIYPEKTKENLAHLYTQYGMTPDVLLP